jgi:hypothetical protein
MTTPITHPTAGTTAAFTVPMTKSSAAGGSSFDAALKASQAAKAKDEERTAQVKAIREKGFTAWVGEMRIEKLKEELRKKALSAMGLDEESLQGMAPVMRQLLEKKIEEEVASMLEEELRQQTSEAVQDGVQNDGCGAGALPRVAALPASSQGQSEAERKKKLVH